MIDYPIFMCKWQCDYLIWLIVVRSTLDFIQSILSSLRIGCSHFPNDIQSDIYFPFYHPLYKILHSLCWLKKQIVLRKAQMNSRSQSLLHTWAIAKVLVILINLFFCSFAVISLCLFWSLPSRPLWINPIQLRQSKWIHFWQNSQNVDTWC